jgi:hypothetical protein
MKEILKVISKAPQLYESPVGRQKLTHHEIESRMIFSHLPGITKKEIVFRKVFELTLIPLSELNKEITEVENFLSIYKISKFLGLRILLRICDDILKIKKNPRILYNPF